MGQTNYIFILDGPEEDATVYLSYNEDAMWGKGEETALCFSGQGHRKNQYFILHGDHRKGYTTAWEKGKLEAVNQYFIDNEKEHGSGWSSDASPEDFFKEFVEGILSKGNHKNPNNE